MPTKESVRAYMQARTTGNKQHTPPPTLEEIRRRLGWNLVNVKGGRR
jgi:hypothetical protein